MGVVAFATMPDELDDDTLAFAHRVFDLARHGSSEELGALLTRVCLRT
jgi:hypothetical protein